MTTTTTTTSTADTLQQFTHL